PLAREQRPERAVDVEALLGSGPSAAQQDGELLVQRAEHVQGEAVRHLALVLDRAAFDQVQPPLGRPGGERAEQRGLADPGLADHAEQGGAAAAHIVERARRQFKFAIAAGELHLPDEDAAGGRPYSNPGGRRREVPPSMAARDAGVLEAMKPMNSIL